MSLTLLIERLGASPEPSRDLDRDIHIGLGLAEKGAETYGPYLRQRIACARYTESVDAAIGLCDRVLPGWAWRIATCCVSDDAWVFPDFNSPEHGERLQREFDTSLDWSDLTDVDLRPAGRPAIALLISVLKAKLIIGGAA